jgi:hypothetical protein
MRGEPVSHVFADGGLGREAANATVRLLGWACLKRLIQQRRDALIVERARTAWARLVAQPRHACFDIARAPFAYRRLGDLQLLADVTGTHGVRADQHDSLAQESADLAHKQ